MRAILPLIAGVLAAALALPWPPPARACSCGGGPPTTDDQMRERLASSDNALVVAVVEGAIGPEPVDGGKYATLPGAAFRVERVYRGDVPARFEMGYITCTKVPDFRPGSRWLVEMKPFEGRWQSDLCSITSNVASPQAARYLPSLNRIIGQPPLLLNDDSDASRLPAVLVVAGLAALAVGSMYVAGRRARA